MKRVRYLLLLLAIGSAYADEITPSVNGHSFVVSGAVTHFKLPAGVKVQGAPDGNTYAEEIYGSKFSATVAGLPAGTYTVNIDFAEVYNKGPNQRVMKITSGDTVLAEKLDLFSTAGFAKAYTLKTSVVHQEDTIRGPLEITFTGTVGNAKINAIHILDQQGNNVASFKVSDLVDAVDAAASKIPTVSDPVIYTNADKPMDDRVDDLIRRMSLSEKVMQLMNAAPGIPRLNVPEYNYWSESLHGVARNGHATVFPQVVGMAAAWDDAIMHKVGEVIAVEGRAKYYEAQREGIHKDNHGLTFWAPNINIYRDPRWGRGQETYGEDPYLTARLSVNFIEGMQGNDPKYLETIACAKHFAVHSGPEHGRGSFNVDPDERDLYETFLPQFQAAVEEAHVGSVMAAYNSINNVPCACNSWLLTDLLRKKWGFDGHVVSDCGAVGNIVGAHHYAKGDAQGDADAIEAGLDLECGGNYRHLVESVAQGLIKQSDVDNALHRVIKARFSLGLFDPPERVPFSNIAMSEVESPEHLALARQLARESMVLLKNDHLLPLDKTKLTHIVVLGANATARLDGNYNGEPTTPITVLDGIKTEVGDGVKVEYFKGAPLTNKPKHPKDNVSPADYKKALDAAKTADVIIYVGGLDTELEGEESSYESPGFDHGDRTAIEIPVEQDKLLRDLQATGKPVVFVNCSGSCLAMPWEADNIPAILQAWYPGGQGGAAVADVLFGKCNPSGKLPITFYAKTGDLPSFTDYHMTNRTYRYFTGKPLYPFGYGLSFTKFDYLPLVPDSATVSDKDTIHITVPVKNSGDRDGDDVVEVYLHHKDSPVPQPLRSLIAFKRVTIPKGTTAQVSFDIPVERFHYWSVEKKAYVVDQGQDEIQVGSSSSDVQQICAITVK